MKRHRRAHAIATQLRQLAYASLRRGFLVAVLAIAFATPAWGKLPEGATPRETAELARRAVRGGAFGEAIPLLTQLIEWLHESKRYANDVAKYRFQLGLCHYLTGSFPGARDAFRTYLGKHRNGKYACQASIYLGDSLRFDGKLKDALPQYKKTLKGYPLLLDADLRTDIYSSMARCHLAADNWKDAIPMLMKVYRNAPDQMRASWAATLLTVAYLKELQLDNVYELVPYLMNEDSLAGCSVAFNLSALEAGDGLFADERYRDALWVYRLVHPRAWIEKQAKRQVRKYRQHIEDLYEQPGKYRELMRAQETLGEAEAAVTALKEVKDYDVELKFRIARSYMEVRRFRDARGLFLNLRSVLDETQAEEPLYLGFICSTSLRPWDRAFQHGMEYLKDYPHPKGQYYDAVSLSLGQMHAALKQWPKVISVVTKALEVHPEHESSAECMFLVGYASFMEEKYGDAIKWLKGLNDTFPEHERVEESTYWLGMAYLFHTNYKKGFQTFDHFVGAFPDSPYVEDATFRRAVCQYGQSLFAETEASLLAFNERYPRSKLVGESYMMLADISGSTGRLKQAVKRFDRAIKRGDDLNIELYNYCCFRRGEMSKDLEDFPAIEAHFTAYIERNREGSNLPMAVYWVATAKWQKDDKKGAMDYLLAKVESYGRDRRALGIDLLLQEWVSKSQNLQASTRAVAWERLRTRARELEKDGSRTLALRMKHILLFAPAPASDKDDPPKADRADVAQLRAELLNVANVAAAPPTVLEYMIDEGPKDGKPELATAAAEAVLQDFPETDYVVPARMWLAREAIKSEAFQLAETHLDVIREVFATSDAAADALLMLGDMYLSQKRPSKADTCYKDVLSVRSWRGPRSPRAVFGRGECARQRRQYLEACAFYERIYLLYAHYSPWVAKAYLARAQCLERLRKPGAAREVLETMLVNEKLAEFPEFQEAKALLAKTRSQP